MVGTPLSVARARTAGSVGASAMAASAEARLLSTELTLRNCTRCPTAPVHCPGVAPIDVVAVTRTLSSVGPQLPGVVVSMTSEVAGPTAVKLNERVVNGALLGKAV